MAKRFTETDKWKDPWFCDLEPLDKLFWVYLMDNCNHAGIWQVNWPLVEFHIPEFRFNEETFKDRVEVISEEKWHVPKFINYQYGELNPDNRAHLSVINQLKKEGVFKGLTRSLQGRKDKDKEQVKDKYKDYKFFKESEFIESYKGFLEMRKKKRKQPTARAENMLLKKLHKYTLEEAVKMLDQSTLNGWTDVYELKRNNLRKEASL